MTGSNGAVVSRHDYQPFGEELFAGMGGRTSAQGYSSQTDTLRQKFTGYERDGETGLDYAHARYYSSTQARFTSADPYDINMVRQYEPDYEKANKLLYRYITNPLRWNRYSYALNNPLRYVDPTGEKEEEIIVKVNIVYDKNHLTEKAAKELTAATVADATQTYATAGIKLEVTYTAGTASTNNVYDTSQHITEGKVEGAVNVYVSNDIGYHTGGRTNTETGESFIHYGRQWSGTARLPPEVSILAHELGHQFGINSSYGSNLAQDIRIDMNNRLLNAGITTVRKSPHITRGGLMGSERIVLLRNPIIDVYRNGARRFAQKQ